MGDQHYKILISLLLAFTVTGCEDTGKQASESDSSGLPSRAVTVSWDASNAKQVAETGGGYLVYVAKTSVAIGTVTPVQIANPGNGTHVTSLVKQLTPGTYNFAVKAYSTESTSELSTITNFTVPQ
ncbi:MAG: fibronectin type III domain-containing protein [Bdellovibrionales bacterium]|nr:fibronectin type III domain-containing protein [Bdellovibrionales bacterium]